MGFGVGGTTGFGVGGTTGFGVGGTTGFGVGGTTGFGVGGASAGAGVVNFVTEEEGSFVASVDAMVTRGVGGRLLSSNAAAGDDALSLDIMTATTMPATATITAITNAAAQIIRFPMDGGLVSISSALPDRLPIESAIVLLPLSSPAAVTLTTSSDSEG